MESTRHNEYFSSSSSFYSMVLTFLNGGFLDLLLQTDFKCPFLLQLWKTESLNLYFGAAWPSLSRLKQVSFPEKADLCPFGHTFIS